MEVVPTAFEVGSVLLDLAAQAHELYMIYSHRDKERKQFARFMLYVVRIVKAVKGSVPQHALPVAVELVALLRAAAGKITKYRDRDFWLTVWHLRSEKERMRSIMQSVQQLLPLLTISVASASNASAASAELQSCADLLQATSTEAAAHLRHLRATADALAAATATLPAVEQCMATLRDSMLQLHGDSMEKVLEGCGAMHARLADGIHEVAGSVLELKGAVVSFSTEMLAGQCELKADVSEIKSHLVKLCGMAESAADSLHTARIMEAIVQLCDAKKAQLLKEAPPSNKQWAAKMREAILAGRLAITACLVLGVPLMPEGPLRPVTLPCCGLVISHAGAQQALDRRQCAICHTPLDPSDDATGVVDNETVSTAVAAEGHGFAPKVFRSSDVELGKEIGRGGEAAVVEGRVRLKGALRRVAVKRVPLAAAPGAAELASVRHVVATSYIAGVASPYVCDMHGYCWTDSELWLFMELCDGTLADFVRRVKKDHCLPGLPPLDVVNLGLMLCSALGAVHRSARCLHLDLTPRNVLLVAHAHDRKTHACDQSGDAESTEGSRTCIQSARLCDFGLSKNLPTRVRSSVVSVKQESLVEGVAKGTPGYAPKEQLLGKGRRRSDVYSLGATLLYAATGADPFGADNLEAIMMKLCTGTGIQVPKHIKPEPLWDLLSEMTAFEVDVRPYLTDVQHRLLSLEASLLASGEAPRFVTPTSSRISTPTAPHAGTGAIGQAVGGSTVSQGSGIAYDAVSSSDLDGASTEGAPPRRQSQLSLGLQSGSDPESTRIANAEPHGSDRRATMASRSEVDGCCQSHQSHLLDGSASSSASAEPAVTAAATSEPRAPASADGAMHESPAMAQQVDSDDAGLHAEPVQALVTTHEDVSGINTVEQLFSRMSRCQPGCVFDFRGAKLRLTANWKAKGSSSRPTPLAAPRYVAQLSQGAGVIANATVLVGSEGAVLLCGSSRVELHKVHFQGGRLVSRGPQCHVAVRGATLEGCALRVRDGATVHLSDGVRALRRQNPIHYLWGAGTSVHASDVSIDGGIAVCGGASLVGERVRVRLGAGDCAGVRASGEGTEVSLTQCEVGLGDGVEPSAERCGVSADEKARVWLSGCTVKTGVRGICVDGGARMTCMRDCKVDGDDAGVEWR